MVPTAQIMIQVFHLIMGHQAAAAPVGHLLDRVVHLDLQNISMFKKANR
jgi:hypothetical protein